MQSQVAFETKATFNTTQKAILVSAWQFGAVYPSHGGRASAGTDREQYHSEQAIQTLVKQGKLRGPLLKPLETGGYALTLEGKEYAKDLANERFSSGLRCHRCNDFIYDEGMYRDWQLRWCGACDLFSLWNGVKLWGTLE